MVAGRALVAEGLHSEEGLSGSAAEGGAGRRAPVVGEEVVDQRVEVERLLIEGAEIGAEGLVGEERDEVAGATPMRGAWSIQERGADQAEACGSQGGAEACQQPEDGFRGLVEGVDDGVHGAHRGG